MCERKYRADIYVPPRGIVFRTGETGLCETGCTLSHSRREIEAEDRCWSVKRGAQSERHEEK